MRSYSRMCKFDMDAEVLKWSKREHSKCFRPVSRCVGSNPTLCVKNLDGFNPSNFFYAEGARCLPILDFASRNGADITMFFHSLPIAAQQVRSLAFTLPLQRSTNPWVRSRLPARSAANMWSTGPQPPHPLRKKGDGR